MTKKNLLAFNFRVGITSDFYTFLIENELIKVIFGWTLKKIWRISIFPFEN